MEKYVSVSIVWCQHRILRCWLERGLRFIARRDYGIGLPLQSRLRVEGEFRV